MCRQRPLIFPLCFEMMGPGISSTTLRQNSLHVLLWRIQDKASAELLQNLLRGSLAACHQESLLQSSTWDFELQVENEKCFAQRNIFGVQHLIDRFGHAVRSRQHSLTGDPALWCRARGSE